MSVHAFYYIAVFLIHEKVKFFSQSQKGHLIEDLSRHLFMDRKLIYTSIIDKKISSLAQVISGEIRFLVRLRDLWATLYISNLSFVSIM